MRDKGPVGKIEAILIAQRIIETCTQYNYTRGCVRCPFRSSPDRGCWLEGLKVDIAELDIVEEMKGKSGKQLNLELKYSTGRNPDALDEAFRSYKAAIERIAKEGVDIPLEEYGRLENTCLSFLSMVKDLNMSVSIGSFLTGMLAGRGRDDE